MWSTSRKGDARSKESEQFSKKEHDLANSKELDRYEEVKQSYREPPGG